MVTVAETNSLHLKFHGWKTTFLLERPTFGCYVSGRARDPALTSCYISNPMETMVLLSIFLHIRCMISCMKSINYLQVILSFSKHQGHDGHEIKTPMFPGKNGDRTWHHGDQSTSRRLSVLVLGKCTTQLAVIRGWLIYSRLDLIWVSWIVQLGSGRPSKSFGGSGNTGPSGVFFLDRLGGVPE